MEDPGLSRSSSRLNLFTEAEERAPTPGSSLVNVYTVDLGTQDSETGKADSREVDDGRAAESSEIATGNDKERVTEKERKVPKITVGREE